MKYFNFPNVYNILSLYTKKSFCLVLKNFSCTGLLISLSKLSLFLLLSLLTSSCQNFSVSVAL